MQHTDKARAEFEAWWIRQPFHELFEDVKDQMGNVWVARGEQMAVTLVEPDPNDYASIASFRAAEAMQKECRAAIEAAGGSVRG